VEDSAPRRPPPLARRRAALRPGDARDGLLSSPRRSGRTAPGVPAGRGRRRTRPPGLAPDEKRARLTAQHHGRAPLNRRQGFTRDELPAQPRPGPSAAAALAWWSVRTVEVVPVRTLPGDVRVDPALEDAPAVPGALPRAAPARSGGVDGAPVVVEADLPAALVGCHPVQGGPEALAALGGGQGRERRVRLRAGLSPPRGLQVLARLVPEVKPRNNCATALQASRSRV
jgi:hypothetical protein